MAFSNFNNGATVLNPPPVPPMGLGLMNTQQSQIQFDASQQQILNGQQQQQHAIQQQMQRMQQLQMQHMQQMMHPGLNDQPLEFNIEKNKPAVAIINDEPSNNSSDEADRRDSRESRRSGRDRDRRDRRDRDRGRERSGDRKNKRDEASKSPIPPLPPPQTQVANPPLPPAMPGMGMMGMSPMMSSMMTGMMTPSGMVPMMSGMDPSLMGMGQFGVMPGMMQETAGVLPAEGAIPTMMTGDFTGQRHVLEFKDCTLVPPSPMAPPPVTRERPPGCRTVYVGGLPDNCTEDIIKDVFRRCGEMLTVRLSKKNFCHIRFAHENSVNAAMLYSGYRMRIGNNTDAANTGRLHVDYAQARVDQYEWECRQRALQREARHRERMERDRSKPASPPAFSRYTDHEASVISDQIKSDEGFKESVQTVIAWLERGDLSKKNANTFYSMIQSTHTHVRRLLSEKMQYEEELQTAKDLHRTRVQGIIMQFEFVEKIFTSASHKKCWDHFTKAQRKNIESWKKQTIEIKQLQMVDSLNEEAEEEMDVSDNDDNEFGPSPKKRGRVSDVNTLKDENDSLKCQLEAYKNEVYIMKADFMGDIDTKDRQIKLLKQTIQNMRTEMTSQEKRLEEVKKLKSQEDERGFAEEEKKIKEDESAEVESSKIVTSDRDAKFVGLIATFLHVHPFGAGLDYVWSYLSKIDSSLKPNEVEALMSRFPSVFRQQLSGIGAAMERKWVFCGFETGS